MPKVDDKVNPQSHFYIGISGVRRNPSRGSLWVRPRLLFGARTFRRAPLLVCLFMLAGCSVSMPMASLLPAKHDDETGAIAKPQLANWLDNEDWQRAKPAFDEALAEKTASAVTWANPDSGAKGKFMAVGQAFSGIAGRCRGFHATIVRSAADKALEGTACADKAGTWQITEVKSAKQG